MMYTLLTMIVFSAAYAIKGGQLRYVFSGMDKLRTENKVLDRLLDGKILSTFLVIFFLSFVTVNWQVNVGLFQNASLSIFSIAVAWLLAIAPSVGEEYGAIIGNGPYVDHKADFGRLYGLKKGIQRGMWSGAIMALATGFVPFLWAALAFMPLASVSLTAGRRWGFDGWAVSEMLIGGVCFGIPMGMYLGSL